MSNRANTQPNAQQLTNRVNAMQNAFRKRQELLYDDFVKFCEEKKLLVIPREMMSMDSPMPCVEWDRENPFAFKNGNFYVFFNTKASTSPNSWNWEVIASASFDKKNPQLFFDESDPKAYPWDFDALKALEGSKVGIFTFPIHVNCNSETSCGAVVIPYLCDESQGENADRSECVKILVLSEFRLAQGGNIIGLPRGFGEKLEISVKTACREFGEETGLGLEATNFVKLGKLLPDTGFSANRVDLFAVRLKYSDLSEIKTEEGSKYHLMSLKEILNDIADDKLSCMFTRAAIATFCAILMSGKTERLLA